MKNKLVHKSHSLNDFIPSSPKGGWTWRTINKDFLQVRKPGGKGFPKQGESFGDLYPQIAKEFYTEWNAGTSPNDFRSFSKVIVFWRCPEGHIYPADIANRVIGNGCPLCAGQRPTREQNLRTLYPDIATQWHATLNGRWLPDDFLPGSDAKAVWLCLNNPEHIWVSAIKHRVYMKSGCPHCHGGTSRPEMRLLAELQTIFGKKNVHDRIKLHKQEVDLFIRIDGYPPICIEFDGGYYHQNKKKQDDAKLRKLETAGETVIRLRGEGVECIRQFDVPVTFNEESKSSPELAFKMFECLSIIFTNRPPYDLKITNYLKEREAKNC